MSIPDYQTLFLPVLRMASDGNEHSTADIRDRVATELKLTPEEVMEKLPSGVQTVFANRIAWSVVYLTKAGVLERVKRGVFKITDRGRELLGRGVSTLTNKDLSAYPEFVAFQRGPQKSHNSGPDGKIEKTETPEEQLANAYTILRNSLATDVLDAVRKASPTFFEQIVIDLLVGMGYGGSVEDAGKAVGRAGDGGIDGIIKEDKLGLDVVYVQAKRWAASVGRPVVQAFAGSLEGFKAKKGVMITTSFYTQDALEYVQKIEKRIVLIDGEQLAEHMIDHNIGVSAFQTYTIKRLNSDYFDV
jgi:restriction system protein